MNTTIKTLSTVTALGADCVVSNGVAYITGLSPMLVKGMKPAAVVAPVTEVLQVTTGTPTVANSTLYAINLVYTNKVTGILESKDFTYTSDADATATEICDYFRNTINGLSEVIAITATGTTTLILTAVTGNYSAQAQFGVTSYGTGVMAFVTGTAAVVGVGKGVFLNGGLYSDTNLVNASYYYQVITDFNNAVETGSSMKESPLFNRNVLYVLSTATGIETLVGTYGTITQLLAGKAATWVASGGTIAYTVTTGVITLTVDTFTSAGLLVGDITMIGATTALAAAQASTILSILTQSTAVGTNIVAVAAASGFYVKLRAI